MSKSTPSARTAACRALAATALLAACAAAQAAPFAITYSGTMGPPPAGYESFGSLVAGQGFTLTFILDNGGTTAAGQTWNEGHLTCVLWRMNDARSAAYAQDLVARPANASRSVTTGPDGRLTAVFNTASGNATDPAHYSARGILVPNGITWWADMGDVPFEDNRGVPPRAFTAPGGIAMTPARWTAPLPFAGNCDADAVPPMPAPAPGSGNATPVPALGLPALALLAAGAAGLGARRLRRRPSNQS